MKSLIFFAVASFLVGYALTEDMLDQKDMGLSEHLDDEDMALAELLDDEDMALEEDLDDEDMDLSELDTDTAVENPLNDEQSRSGDCIPQYHDCTKNRHGCCRGATFKYKCKCFYKEGKNGKPTNKEMCTCQQTSKLKFMEEAISKVI
ncbi:uncharacterized protein TNIN_491341 [Trichonephila inaurata madagascariensis]|uniref:Uncharacterized protein n=1 Tax=Trichonephila inaurata madagascariensis TaxID=2747483 RepID=A0A8X7CLM0_9ARAC|nr:uncharacterized protein TNIN_491341 [Trichonephila inaurata madagascariensis]